MDGLQKFKLNDWIFHTEDAFRLADELKDCETVRLPKGTDRAFNIPCSFDIETTSFYDENGDKVGLMYIWQLGVNGNVIIGRTWEELTYVLKVFKNMMGISLKKRLIIYVHNLAFEFQFISHLFNWEKVFAVDNRKVAKAVTFDGFEFRCSYLLSGVSLAKMGEDLVKYKVEKMVGDLDYSKLRHAKTRLTDEELKYCVNDVLVVMAYIQEKIERDGSIAEIPMTRTAYVRRLMQNKCLYGNKSHSRDKKGDAYRKLMKSLTLTVPEYEQLKRAFSGGFTHASPLFSNMKCSDVTSYDFTSSYPTVLIAEQFPMSKAELVEVNDEETLRHYLDCYCCVFDIRFNNLRSKFIYENYLSESKCTKLENPIINNGRIYSADLVSTTITDVDFNIIEQVYDYDSIQVANFRIYKRGYLPKPFIETVVSLYKTKTELKDVEGREEDYMACKGDLNSCYGMIATDITRPEHNFIDGAWKEVPANIEEQIEKYNKDKKRCLFYPWAVFTTAYARRNLWNGILEMGEDYIYSDTDSVKIMNAEKHLDFINNYNEWIIKRLKRACEVQEIDPEDIEPKTIKGKKKPLGVWDYDGHYDSFKTLGAKRYMTEANGKYSLTVSGLNKKTAMPYLVKTFDDVFAEFKNGLKIDGDNTGKLTHTYIDDVRKGTLIDYNGVSCKYEVQSGIHLEPAEYQLGLSDEYLKFLSFIGGVI